MAYAWIASLNGQIDRSTGSRANSTPAEIHSALARVPWAKNHIPVVYKYFKQENEATAIANELYGYYLAKKLGLPVCKSIDVCVCDKRLLAGPSRCMEGRDPKSQWFRGIATTDETPAGIISFPPKNSTRILVDELRGWRFLPEAAVFDGLVGNRDRNLGNLYRVREGKFLLIDHADILAGQGWSLCTLEERLQNNAIPNYLAGFVAEETQKGVQDRMMAIAVDIGGRKPFAPEHVGINPTLADKQCGLEKGTTNEVFDAIGRRQQRLPELIFHHLKCADLFN